MKLTIALQNEMTVLSSPIGKGGSIVIDIPNECARDLWKAQVEMWLEDQNKIIDDAYLRVSHNDKMKLDKCRI